MQDSQSAFFRKPIVHIMILALLAVVVYSNSFHVPFLFDDEPSITENLVIRSLSDFISDGYAFNPRRFIGYLTLALNYHFGGFSVVGYHVFNLAVHIATTLLVYYLVRLTFRTPFLHRSTLTPRSDILALAVALLFVTHPIQTQAVTYLIQRLASLATMFYLAALVLHIRWRLARESGAEFLSGSVAPYFLLSLLSALLAMKTKEMAFTLPVIVLLYECSFFGIPDLRRLGTLVPMLLTALIIPLSMLSINKPVGELLSDLDKATVAGTTLPRWDYLCTQFNVIVTYLRLLFLPIGQNLDYDYPASHFLFEPRTFFSLLLLLTLFAAALLLWRRSGAGGNPTLRIASFGILWFFITLSVESSIIPIIDVIFEHRLYLPSVGFFIALVTLCAVAVERSALLARFQIPVLIVVTVLLSGATYARNTVWQDGLSLWNDVVAKSPNKARPYNNLGTNLKSLKRFDEAEKMFGQALNIDPEMVEAHTNLGAVHYSKGNLEAAKKEYQAALRTKPDYAKAHNNLGLIFARQGDVDTAVKEFQEAVNRNPNYSNAHNNLGFALLNKGEFDGAVKEFRETLRIDPNNANARNNLKLAIDKKMVR